MRLWCYPIGRSARSTDDARLSCNQWLIYQQQLTRAMQKTETQRAVVIMASLIPLGYSGSSLGFSRTSASSARVLSKVSPPRCCKSLLPSEEMRETGTWRYFSLSDRFFSLYNEEPLLESGLASAGLDCLNSSMLDGEAALIEVKVCNFLLPKNSRGCPLNDQNRIEKHGFWKFSIVRPSSSRSSSSLDVN